MYHVLISKYILHSYAQKYIHFIYKLCLLKRLCKHLYKHIRVTVSLSVCTSVHRYVCLPLYTSKYSLTMTSWNANYCQINLVDCQLKKIFTAEQRQNQHSKRQHHQHQTKGNTYHSHHSCTVTSNVKIILRKNMQSMKSLKILCYAMLTKR